MAAEAAPVPHAENTPFGRLQIAAPVPREAAGRWLIGALLVMVTLSGVSGLSYQVLWVRSLSLTFGVTTIAVTAVLAGFMAGLALGSFLGGRLADRVRQPLVLYGLIEIGIGVFGLLSPRAFAALPELYRWLPQSASGESDAFGTAVRVGLAFLIIVLPTTLMGATLPVVVKAAVGGDGKLHRDVSWLYAANTAGAIVGTVVAGFVLIGGYGMQVTAMVAGALNLTAGVLALLLAPLVGTGHRSAGQGDAALPLDPLAELPASPAQRGTASPEPPAALVAANRTGVQGAEPPAGAGGARNIELGGLGRVKARPRQRDQAPRAGPWAASPNCWRDEPLDHSRRTDATSPLIFARLPRLSRVRAMMRS